MLYFILFFKYLFYFIYNSIIFEVLQVYFIVFFFNYFLFEQKTPFYIRQNEQFARVFFSKNKQNVQNNNLAARFQLKFPLIFVRTSKQGQGFFFRHEPVVQVPPRHHSLISLQDLIGKLSCIIAQRRHQKKVLTNSPVPVIK